VTKPRSGVSLRLALVCTALAGSAVAVFPSSVGWARVLALAAVLTFPWHRLRSATKQPEGELYPENRFQVKFDSVGVTCTPPDGPVEHVRWDDLIRIEVRTTSGGPWSADVWWVLTAQNGSACQIPQGARGEKALTEHLLGREGFDREAFGDAMRCTDNRVFVCWQAGDHQAAVSPEA